MGFLIYLFFCFKEYNDTERLQFEGTVQDIHYDIKGDITVTIQGKVYTPISNNWAFRGKVQKGDSLIKYKNSLVIKLIKQTTKEVIIFR
ncbi:hypothetical protein BEL04_16330 [Mucilaginibacter sp. PPCGB 2223]|nr:hypothetical protein BEL04_16330 [Mucilaginibacter sp. PPCGB 2223]